MPSGKGPNRPAGQRGIESPAITEQLMEEVCERENLQAGIETRSRPIKEAAGVDGMTVLSSCQRFLKEHWPAIREQLLSGTYKPQPVRRVEIPKPDGGVRKLGIPTVSANCTGAQIAFRMGGDPPSVPSASRPALPGFEGAPVNRY